MAASGIDDTRIYNKLAAVDAANAAEDLFVELFLESFGLDKIQYLVNEYPCQNIYGDTCYIDYALKTDSDSFAIEIDGEQWHNPALISLDKYLDDLLKRNSLTYQGWKVFIWTYRQLVNDRERVKSELVQFLGRSSHFRIHEDYLPMQKAALVNLRPHHPDSSAGAARRILHHGPGRRCPGDRENHHRHSGRPPSRFAHPVHRPLH